MAAHEPAPQPAATRGMADSAGDADMPPAHRSAQFLLQKASTMLEQVGERLQPPPPPEPAAPAPARPDLLWATLQVEGAQRQIAASMAMLFWPAPRRRPAAGRAGGRASIRWASEGGFGGVFGALALAGAALLALSSSLAVGVSAVTACAIGAAALLAAAVVWGWRAVISARGLRIAMPRSGPPRER